MTNPLFFAAEGALAHAAPGHTVEVSGDEARHALAVRRLSVGETVDVGDGRGTRVTGEVSAGANGVLTVLVRTVSYEAEPVSRITLVQALAKGDRDAQAIEMATEFGVDAVRPWQADRSIVRWRADKAAKGAHKWRGILRAAAKQSRRAWIPEVLPLVDSGTLTAALSGEGHVLVLHEDAPDYLADVYRRLCSDTGSAIPSPVVVVVGPEGGISPQELEVLIGAGAHPVRLGPLVLRSSSAGPAALVLLNDLLRRWPGPVRAEPVG